MKKAFSPFLILTVLSAFFMSSGGAQLQVSVMPDTGIGSLRVESPDITGGYIEFGSCEGIIDGSRDFGLFQIKLDGKPENGGRKWQVNGKEFSYQWKYPQGIELKFSAKVESDSIALNYVITNKSPDTLNNPNIHVCMQTKNAPAFFPGQPYTELYDRLYLWSGGRKFAMSETELGRNEVHLALRAENEQPVSWGWWKYSGQTFDIPLLVMESKDRKNIAALAFEDAVWASCNAGDDRACVHLFPYFGEIKPGGSAAAKGRLYVLKGTADTVLKRFYKEFRPELPFPPVARSVKVAMCQIVCLDSDREGNFVRIENALREASKAGAGIACFPESSILGWVNPDAHTRAYPIPGNDTDRLCELARRYKIYICAGLDEKDGNDLYDAAVLIDDAGQLLMKHRKMNNLDDVQGLMVPNYKSGNKVNTADTRWGKIGVLICADTFGDYNLRRMAYLKPVLVLVPYGWVNGQTAWPQHGGALAGVVSNAARILGAPVVGTDSVGQVTHGCWAGSYYGGASVACDAQGRKIGNAADRDRDVKIVEIPLSEIE